MDVRMPDGTIVANVPDGITQTELLARYSKYQSAQQTAEPPERVPFSLKDTGLSFAQGVVGAGKSITDVAGAANPVSEYLGGIEKSLGESMTPARQAEIQRRQEASSQAAKTGSITDEIATALGGVAEAPVQSLAQGLGSIVPYVGTSIVGGVAKLGGMTIKALNTIVGMAQGAGSIKGSVYDNVKQELEKSGVAPAVAAQKATEAQNYLGENFLDIVAGAGLGALGARTGIENLLTKEGAEKASQRLIPRVSRAIAGEVPVEGAQAGQEEIAKNRALQKQGYDVPTFQGAAGAAARDMATAGLTAGVVGGVRSPTPMAPAAPAAPAADLAAAPAEPVAPAAVETAIRRTPEEIAADVAKHKESFKDFNTFLAANPTPEALQELYDLNEERLASGTEKIKAKHIRKQQVRLNKAMGEAATKPVEATPEGKAPEEEAVVAGEISPIDALNERTTQLEANKAAIADIQKEASDANAEQPDANTPATGAIVPVQPSAPEGGTTLAADGNGMGTLVSPADNAPEGKGEKPVALDLNATVVEPDAKEVAKRAAAEAEKLAQLAAAKPKRVIKKSEAGIAKELAAKELAAKELAAKTVVPETAAPATPKEKFPPATVAQSLKVMESTKDPKEFEAHLDYITADPTGKAQKKIPAWVTPKQVEDSFKRNARLANKDEMRGITSPTELVAAVDRIKDSIAAYTKAYNNAEEDGDTDAQRSTQSRLVALNKTLTNLKGAAKIRGVVLTGKRVAAEHIRKPTGAQSRYSLAGQDTARTDHTSKEVADTLRKQFANSAMFDNLVKVHQTENDLLNAHPEIAEHPDYHPGVRGVAHQGKVHLVANKIKRGQELGVLLHEAGAHIGFDQLEKAGYISRKELADRVHGWAAGDDVKAEAARVAIAKGINDDEVIAYTVEELVNRGATPKSFRPESTFLRVLANAIKKVLGLKTELTPERLVDAAFSAAHMAMERGTVKGDLGDTRFSTGSTILDEAAVRRQQSLVRSGDKSFLQQLKDSVMEGKFIENKVNAFITQTADSAYTVKKKLNKAGIDTTTKGDKDYLDALYSLSFASTSADTAVSSLLTGPIALDATTGAFQAIKGASMMGVHKHVREIAKKLGGEVNAKSIKTAETIFDLGAIVLREQTLSPDKRNAFKFNPDDLAAGAEALRLYGPEIRAAMDEWTTYKNALLDMAQSTGRFSAEDVAEWKKAADYVPWNRVLDDAKFGHQTKSSAKQFFKGLHDSGKIKELVGGDVGNRPIGDILNNMEGLAFWIVNATIQNHTANKVMDGLLKLDAIEVNDLNAKDIDIKRIVKTYVGGVEKRFMVGDALDAYAFIGTERVTMPLLKVFATGAGWLRKGTTLMPGFVASQLFQDGFRAAAYSGVNSPFKAGSRILSEFGKEMRGDKLSELLASFGIIGRPDSILGDEKSRVRDALDNTSTGVRRAAKTGFHLLDKMTRASDAAQRRAVYKQVLAEGGTEREALYKAIEIINFHTHGAHPAISVLRHIVPFTNAYIQGMSVALKNLAGHGISPGERAVAMRTFYATAAKIAALSTLYAMLVSDDDDYQRTPDYMKVTGFIIPGTREMIKSFTGSDPGGNIKIPSPVDPAGLLFKVIPEIAYNYVSKQGTSNEIDATKLRRMLSTATIQAVSPPNAIPQVVKPILEVATNHSFFTGNAIIGKGLEHRAREEQFTASTSELGKLLGKYLPLAPVQVDHLVRGFAGTGGSTMLFATSALIDSVSDVKRPASRLNELPQVRTFLTGNNATGLKEDFYEMREKATEVADTVNLLKLRDPARISEYLSSNMAMYAMSKSGMISKVDTLLGEIRKHREVITGSHGMSAEAKREMLDTLEKQEVAVLSAINPTMLRRLAGM